MSDYAYPGSELELFRHAVNWKSYWCSRLQQYLSGDVLEVGAGNGNNTGFLLSHSQPRSWVSVEPDAQLFQGLQAAHAEFPDRNLTAVLGILKDLPAEDRFDTILYVDVLEHIEDDQAELARAAERLKPGGRVIMMGPALPSLYSPFDKAIGHYRRYNKAMVRALHAPGCRLERVEYLDSVGVFASYANRFLLRKSMPSYGQIMTWDRLFVPVSRVLDKLLFHRAGKSILAVWKRDA